ncbi:MAG: SDR family NAD(P)-dependent oxidoreductase, partial [Alphaproteobacteria bacterium]|nr:SDR family NAD(P)-dependent oxidoreductase [Alphaproteobacteria bacterium]
MSPLLQGHIAVVTGGGSGIGEAIALGYAEQGATVAVLDVNATAGADTARQIATAGGRATSLEVDVTDRAACDAAAAEVQRQLGPISILVNNAGINRRTPITGDKAAVRQDWDDIIDLNIKG